MEEWLNKKDLLWDRKVFKEEPWQKNISKR